MKLVFQLGGFHGPRFVKLFFREGKAIDAAFPQDLGIAGAFREDGNGRKVLQLFLFPEHLRHGFAEPVQFCMVRVAEHAAPVVFFKAIGGPPAGKAVLAGIVFQEQQGIVLGYFIGFAVF